MTIEFTQEEKAWIEMDMFNWHLKEKCPNKLRKKIQRKLDFLNGKKYSYEEGFVNGFHSKRSHSRSD